MKNLPIAEPAQVGIIADDLTSAADGAAPFVARGLRAEVGFHAQPPTHLAVRAIDTGSRNVASTKAAELVTQACTALADSPILYKTVDSTLRGNIAAEVAAALAASGRKRLIFAPAFPAAGRTTHHGSQFVDGILLTQTAYADDPIHPAHSAKLADVLGQLGQDSRCVKAEQISQIAEYKDSVLLIDAQKQSHLDLLVACMPQPENCLWLGSPGLAYALATCFGASVERDIAIMCRRVLVVVGSANPTSRGQIDDLKRQGIPVWRYDQSPQPAPVVCITTPARRQADPIALTAAFVEYVAALMQQESFDGLVVTGGQIAAQLLQAVGVEQFELLGELEAGFPVGVARSPYPLTIALKAGGFGVANTLSAAVSKLMTQSEALV